MAPRRHRRPYSAAMAEAPLSAEEIVHRGFPSSFRGFDPAEVRAYLVRVASELKAASAREHELKQKLTEAERRARNPVIDQDMLMKALGEETSRVLASAQEAARQLKTRAEEGVARILREAHEQAQQIRAAAEVVLADRTEEAEAAAAQIRAVAQAEAASVVDQARREAEAARAEVVDQARQLVHEAQAARARVLGDLARRRRIAHTQVEQLRAGRERLLDAYRVVRRTLDEVADELARAEPEARTAAAVAARRLEAALESGDDLPDEESGEDGAVPSLEIGLAEAAPGGAAGVDEAAVAVPMAPAGAGGPTGVPEPVVTSGTEPAVVQGPAQEPGTAPVPKTGLSVTPLVVARAERIEERKLSSLRILRRTKPDPAPEAEPDVLEARSGVEGVRVIPAAADAAASPPPPGRGNKEPPSVMPGVSWVPAPPDSPPPPTTASSVPTPAPAPAPAPGTAAAAREASPALPVEEDHRETSPGPPSAVEALFARIRADRSAPPSPPEQVAVAAPPTGPDEGPVSSSSEPDSAERPEMAPSNGTGERVSPAPGPDQEESLLQRRDEAIEAIESALARKLKRALQDEHNDVLDRLRSCKGAPSVSAVLPEPANQQARYATAAADLLVEAARSGARFVSAGDADPAAPEVADLVADLTEALVGPLRRGVEGELESGHEDASVIADKIGAAYRECKSQRLERLAGDATIGAFSRGTLSAAAGTDLRWVVDDGDVACPDCDDNALAGPTRCGQQYPTGQSHPPAHAGCRCLLVPGRP